MKTHRQGRPGATTVASRETSARRRLLAALRKICRQLVRMQPDEAARRAGRELERELATLARRRPGKRGG